MVLGLFKSASQRASEALQTHVNALKGIDDQGLGALAFMCSYLRLDALRRTYALATPDMYSRLVVMYYRPTFLRLSLIDGAITKADESLLKFEQKKRAFEHNPAAQSEFGLLCAAWQTWRNTWLGCRHTEVLHMSREMWGLIRIGFPHAESAGRAFIQNPYAKTTTRDVELFEAIIRNEGDDRGPFGGPVPELEAGMFTDRLQAGPLL